MIIEKGKIRERPRVHFPCRCITKFRVGEQPKSSTERLLSGHVHRLLALPNFEVCQRFGNFVYYTSVTNLSLSLWYMYHSDLQALEPWQ